MKLIQLKLTAILILYSAFVAAQDKADSMSKNLIFGKAVQQLYYNVNIKNTSVDTIINEFAKIAHEHRVSKSISSLSINLDMGAGEGIAKRQSHIFSFIISPLNNRVINSGYIEVAIGELGDSKKVLNIDSYFQFINKVDAEIFFEELKNIFIPISSKQNLGYDKLNKCKYAEFSTSNENEKGIKDVIFFLGKSFITNKYQVSCVLLKKSEE